MKRLRTNASDDELLEAGREWIALLAEGRYDDAYAFLAPSEDWTPALIEQVITNYGDIDQVADGETFRVTPIATAKPTPDGLVGILEVDRDDDAHTSCGSIFRSTGSGATLPRHCYRSNATGGSSSKLGLIHVM